MGAFVGAFLGAIIITLGLVGVLYKLDEINNTLKSLLEELKKKDE